MLAAVDAPGGVAILVVPVTLRACHVGHGVFVRCVVVAQRRALEAGDVAGIVGVGAVKTVRTTTAPAVTATLATFGASLFAGQLAVIVGVETREVRGARSVELSACNRAVIV